MLNYPIPSWKTLEKWKIAFCWKREKLREGQVNMPLGLSMPCRDNQKIIFKMKPNETDHIYF